MHPCLRRKSTVYACLIRECPPFPAATAQRIRFQTIGLMLLDRGHAKDVPLLGERFSASYRFYPRDAMLARVFAIATCPSVCLSVRLSVCLSHAGIVPSRAKAGS